MCRCTSVPNNVNSVCTFLSKLFGLKLTFPYGFLPFLINCHEKLLDTCFKDSDQGVFLILGSRHQTSFPSRMDAVRMPPSLHPACTADLCQKYPLEIVYNALMVMTSLQMKNTAMWFL